MVAAYAICTSPRSGSTMLCKMLAATGVSGNPGSHFHVPDLRDWLESYGLEAAAFTSRDEALAAVFAAAIRHGQGGTDVFGLRLQQSSFGFFLKQLEVLCPGRASDLDRVQAAFGPTRFIHLYREDQLGQAISRLRAEQTGLWHRRADGSDLERLAPQRAKGYDADAIRGYMDEAGSMNDAWHRWFRQQGIAPLRVTYERLSQAPQEVLRDVLVTLGQDPDRAATTRVQTAKLADTLSAAWRDRFETDQT